MVVIFFVVFDCVNKLSDNSFLFISIEYQFVDFVCLSVFKCCNIENPFSRTIKFPRGLQNKVFSSVDKIR